MARPAAGAAAPHIAVVGPGEASEAEISAAEEAGRELARGGAVVVCGGLGGVMEAACRGAVQEGGTTVGLLPGPDRRSANPHVIVSIPTGLGEMRNALVVRAADAVIAIGGAGRSYGTLSEIALALKSATPVIGLATWNVPGVEAAESARDAAARALMVRARA